jgi:hypothetical protein
MGVELQADLPFIYNDPNRMAANGKSVEEKQVYSMTAE